MALPFMSTLAVTDVVQLEKVESGSVHDRSKQRDDEPDQDIEPSMARCSRHGTGYVRVLASLQRKRTGSPDG